jgi:hypothetical protein
MESMSSERVTKTTPNPTRLEVIQTRTKGELISRSRSTSFIYSNLKNGIQKTFKIISKSIVLLFLYTRARRN